MKVGLFLSDNQFVEGVLLDVKQDHLVVDVNQNVFYFALQHIQSLSKNAKDFPVSSEIVPYLDRNYLVDVLKALRYNWVTINSLSNKIHFGVLSRIYEDHIILINNEELLYIQKSYISNIYKGIYEINEQLQISQKNYQDSDTHKMMKHKNSRTLYKEEIKIVNTRSKFLFYKRSMLER